MYAKVESGSITKYPYTLQDLRTENPNTSFSTAALENADIRTEYSIEEVAAAAKPTQNPGWVVAEQTPTLVGSTWTQVWTDTAKNVDDLTADEISDTPVPVPDLSQGHMYVEGTPELDGVEWKQTWVQKYTGWEHARQLAYGMVETQIEYIVENGLEAWQTKVAEIKAAHPKT